MQHQLTLQGSPAPTDPPPTPAPVYDVPDTYSMAVDNTQVEEEGLQRDLHHAYCAPEHLPTWLSTDPRHDRPTVRLLRTEWQQAQWVARNIAWGWAAGDGNCFWHCLANAPLCFTLPSVPYVNPGWPLSQCGSKCNLWC
eukprot:942378-Amphidinium_carterae.1